MLNQINSYINRQSEPKRSEMLALHRMVMEIMPHCKLWFLDGKDDNGKVVANPNIGYGSHAIQYAGGRTKEFYQIGISANQTGISVYIFGINDKKYLFDNYADKIGKASVTGYCIKFKTLQHINVEILKAAIRDGIETSTN